MSEKSIHKLAQEFVLVYHYRLGQAYGEAASLLDAEWMEKIIGTIDDPYHSDDNIPKFLELWEETH